MRFTSVLFPFLSLLLLLSCNSNKQEKQEIQIGSWSDLKEYDLKGRIQSLSYYSVKEDSSGKLDILLLNTTEFDSNGLILKTHDYTLFENSGNNSEFRSTEFYHEYKDGYRIKSRIKSADECDSKAFHYSKSGEFLWLEIVQCDTSKLGQYRIDYKLNSEGELVQKTFFSRTKSGIDSSTQYFSDGLLNYGISEKGNRFEQEIISRDSEGNISQYKLKYYDKNKVRDELTFLQSKYDKYGNWTYQEQKILSLPELPKGIILREISYYR